MIYVYSVTFTNWCVFQVVDIKMQVEYMSFSAHADAKGIMQLIRMCEPDNVMLVHGESAKMDFLKSKINKVSSKNISSIHFVKFCCV